MKYPPFCDIILIRFTGKDLKEIQSVSNKMYFVLNKILDKDKILIYKPVPSPVDKIQNKYRYRIILKGNLNLKLIDGIKYSMGENILEKVRETTITVDINPNSMM